MKPKSRSTSRREFLQLSGAALSALAIGCTDAELIAEPVVQDPPPIPVTPPPDLRVASEVSAPTVFRDDDGQLLAYVGRETTYFWPGGGTNPGLRVLLTLDRSSWSGGYGLQLDRPGHVLGPLETIYSIDGHRKWETGLDAWNDASGLGVGPDFVLAYDNAHPPGDRFRMAPGGYLRHGPNVGTPNLDYRFHIQGGLADGSDKDRARHVLYVQSGKRDAPGIADWLIRGEGLSRATGSWGTRVFGVEVDGTVECTAVRVLSEKSWRLGPERLLGSGMLEGLSLAADGQTVFHFAPNGTAFADSGWLTFSPTPPRPPERMSAADWAQWAAEDAAKEVKPYEGVPSPSHPKVLERARATGESPETAASREQERYGKDVSRIAIGSARWVQEVQRALEESRSFDEFRRRVLGPER